MHFLWFITSKCGFSQLLNLKIEFFILFSMKSLSAEKYFLKLNGKGLVIYFWKYFKLCCFLKESFSSVKYLCTQKPHFAQKFVWQNSIITNGTPNLDAGGKFLQGNPICVEGKRVQSLERGWKSIFNFQMLIEVSRNESLGKKLFL